MNRRRLLRRLILVAGLLALVGVLYSTAPVWLSLLGVERQTCCSCTCRTADGAWCSGSVNGRYAEHPCARVCAEACRERGCVPDEATDLPADHCNRLFPWL